MHLDVVALDIDDLGERKKYILQSSTSYLLIQTPSW
jgi:hypothetical protein